MIRLSRVLDLNLVGRKFQTDVLICLKDSPLLELFGPGNVFSQELIQLILENGTSYRAQTAIFTVCL